MNSIRYDIFLFENDLAEYKASDEGQKVFSLISRETLEPKLLETLDHVAINKSLEDYWNARNRTGLHYSNELARSKGKECDRIDAEYYMEIN